tara:strand:- start:14821 stop:15753 length:933 start_codon:yes stop_codon:yes gene_type:complete
MTLVIGNTTDQKLKTKVVQRDAGHIQGRVAIIDITGTITNYAKPGLLREGENPVSLMYEKLQAARNDSKVKAIILRINSPGGTVTASDAIYRQVMQFKQQTHKPVIALFMDVAASGGYYVACAADRIVTYPTAITASIGVILQTVSVKPALQRWGIEPHAFTSGPNKAAGSPFENLTDEQAQILQQTVDDFYARFLHTVKTSRPTIKPSDIPWLTDGRIVTGSTAVQVGLADELGDLQSAYQLAKEMAGIKQAELVRFHRPLQYVGSPYASAPVNVPQTQINIASMDLSSTLAQHGDGFYYLWTGFSGGE